MTTHNVMQSCIPAAFTAHAVHYNFKHYIQSLLNDWPDSDIDLFVSGGGYKNNALVK